MKDFLNLTLGDQLKVMAQKYPDRTAVKYTDRDYHRTWQEFDAECELIARGFMALGLQKGDHIAIWAANIPEWLLTFFASAKMGGVLVTVNTNYKVYELEYLLRQSDTDCLVMMDGFKDNSYLDSIQQLFPKLATEAPGQWGNPMFPRLKHIIYAGENGPKGMIPWSALPGLAQEVPQSALQAIMDQSSEHDVVSMLYTSGTTGFPKGVMLTHYNILNNGKSIGDCMKFTEQDRLCITVPFFHCFGMVLAVMACISHGSAMIPIDAFSPVKVMRALQDEQCTAVHGVPTMFIAMMEHPEFKNFSFPHMRTGIMAGSPCPVKVMQDAVALMNLSEITIVFGQTESSPGCTQTTTDDTLEHRVSTVGRALPGVACKIIDPETGQEVPPGVAGEFCARGYNIMKGYYNMPEATALAVDADGWLHTGDLATVDEEGYFKITGRIKDMIIRGGENIYPKELEDYLYTHEKVQDVQVIGVPSKQYGEEIMACVILKKGLSMTEEEVMDFFRKGMSRHKTPKYVRFMDAFPMTASGKIQKFVLRDEAIELLHLETDRDIETA